MEQQTSYWMNLYYEALAWRRWQVASLASVSPSRRSAYVCSFLNPDPEMKRFLASHASVLAPEGSIVHAVLSSSLAVACKYYIFVWVQMITIATSLSGKFKFWILRLDYESIFRYYSTVIRKSVPTICKKYYDYNICYYGRWHPWDVI